MKRGMSRFFKMLVVFFVSLSFEQVAFAQLKQTKPTAQDADVRLKMNFISGTLKALGPYIASEHEFTNDKNKKVIEQKLSELTQSFEKLEKHPTISNQGLSITQNVMTEQLKQTVNLFKDNKRSQARAKFTTALNLCVSCHAQSPGQNFDKLFFDKDIQSMKLSTFERAELYFITRDYDKAMQYYNQYLLASKKADDDEFIYKALGRELFYFVRIQKDFPRAKKHFDTYLAKKLFNEKITEEVKEWSDTLAGKTLWDKFNPEQVTEEQMKKFMDGFIADSDEGPIFTINNTSEVYDLNLSSILLDYYNAHPETKLGAKILYWLAILDKRVNDDLFYSIGDYYLLSCMEKYPTDSIAKDCFDAYQEDLEFNYITKERPQFPKEISDKLSNLKKIINYKDEE